MNTALFWFSGTGNSLWAARQLAEALEGETELKRIEKGKPAGPLDGFDRVGLVFPVYIWGMPHLVRDFVPGLAGHDYVFSVATCAGDPAGTQLEVRRVLKRAGGRLAAGFNLVLPSNYIPWGGTPKDQHEERFQASQKKIKTIAKAVAAGERPPLERSNWLRCLTRSIFVRFMAYRLMPGFDADFHVDETCNGCGSCARMCPVDNIAMEGGKPTWQHHCEQCFACLNLCPKQALQYGKNTAGVPRYRHPDVNASDLRIT